MIRMSFLFLTLVLASACARCYDCEKQIYIEVNDQLVPTDAYYEEEACGAKERNNWVDQGYTCYAQ